ncbi:MAG: D-alanyl-D-alanine carboxypeptidase, partial [Acidimicrobiaceae bacterium]|nr:D-alanyl-D-alanine carboxypeptidase [Acidimicrobiaceae bacterium]
MVRFGRRWMSAGLVAALLATTGPVAPSALAAPPRDQKPTILGTSVLSVRRAPGWMQRVVEDQRLTSRLQAAMANPALSGPFSASCLVVSQGSKVLYDDGSTRELVPASNMKLLTATAALDKLGPAYRFTTTVDASQAPARGVLKGNLYLVGGGDPFLRTAAYLNEFNPPQPLYTPLAQLAAQVRAAGITRITGSVVGNDGRYDSVRSVPGWKPVYVSEGDAGPLSALDVDDGFPPPGVPPAPVATPPVEAAAAFTQLLKAVGVK